MNYDAFWKERLRDACAGTERKSGKPERVIQSSSKGYRLAWVDCGVTVKAGPWKATRYAASKTKKEEAS